MKLFFGLFLLVVLFTPSLSTATVLQALSTLVGEMKAVGFIHSSKIDTSLAPRKLLAALVDELGQRSECKAVVERLNAQLASTAPEETIVIDLINNLKNQKITGPCFNWGIVERRRLST
jgi:hypothetical protein